MKAMHQSMGVCCPAEQHVADRSDTVGSRRGGSVRRLGLSAAVTRPRLRLVAGRCRPGRRTGRLRVHPRQPAALHHRLRRVAPQRRRRRGTWTTSAHSSAAASKKLNAASDYQLQLERQK